MRASFISILVAGLLAPLALAAPSASKTAQTPHGERPADKVYEVPVGGQVKHVGEEIHLIDANGKVIHVAQNDHSPVRATPIESSKRAEQTGWISYADWTNLGSSPISSFTTTWTVPAAPKTNNDQTIFLFNSIEPASGDAILQPVLQFGSSAAGGGSYWTLASWYLVGSLTFYSSPVEVLVGQTLEGLITLSSNVGSAYNYVSKFSNVAGTSLIAIGSAELVWATETLEVYGVTEASDFPGGSTVFSNINLETSAGTPSVIWSVGASEDSTLTTINTQGATNAEITIIY